MKRSVSFVLSLALVLCMGITMISAEFTPSAEANGVPEIVPPTVDADLLPDGVAAEDVVAVIVNGEEKEYVVDSAVSMISVFEAKNAIEDEEGGNQDDDYMARCEELIGAFDAVSKNGVAASVPGLKAAAEALGVTAPKFTVPYFFELGIEGEALETLNMEGSYITVIFDLADFAELADVIMVAHMVDGEWVLVSAENTVVDVDNGTLSVSFDSLCPVMIVSAEDGDETGSESDSETDSETESETASETESETASEIYTETETESTAIVTESETESESESESEVGTESESESESEPKPAPKDDNTVTVVVIVICCVVAVAGALTAAFFILQKKGVIAEWTKKIKKSRK